MSVARGPRRQKMGTANPPMSKQPQPQHVLVPVDLARAIADYLSKRPFAEVAQFMQGLMQAPAAVVQQPAPQVEETSPTPPPNESLRVG